MKPRNIKYLVQVDMNVFTEVCKELHLETEEDKQNCYRKCCVELRKFLIDDPPAAIAFSPVLNGAPLFRVQSIVCGRQKRTKSDIIFKTKNNGSKTT